MILPNFSEVFSKKSSGNFAPVGGAVDGGLEFAAECGVRGLREGGIAVEKDFGGVAGHLDYRAVGGEVGEPEVEGGAALHGALDVAGTAHLHVGFGDYEAVGGLRHEFEALAGVAADVVAAHEDAVALVGAAAHASAQLVELREAEALGVLDYHHGGVGHVDAYFYHGGGYEDARLAGGEDAHLVLFLVGAHASVHVGHLEVAEGVADDVVAFGEAVEVELLVLVDEGIDYVHLTSGAELGVGGLVDLQPLGLEAQQGGYGLAAGGELVEDADVEVAVDGHGERARDGGGRHHEHVGADVVLGPEACALCYAEAVLLVDYGHAEGAEAHVVLDQGVGAYEYVQRSVEQGLMDAAALAGRGGAFEQGHVHAYGPQHLRDGVVVLRGQYLGGGH